MDRPHHLTPRRAVPAALAAALLVLSGCSPARTGAPTAPGDPGSATASTRPEDPDPTTEDPEPTTPAGTTRTNGNPAISVARLPVGGASEDDPDDPRLQCAQVSWIVDPGGDGEIPKGTAVELTRALFTPDAFVVQRAGCGTEQPNCIGYIFRSAQQRCDLLVKVVGTVPEGVEPSVGFAGLVYCPRNSSDSCQRFVAALGAQKQISVQLNVPPAPTTEPTTSTTSE